MTHGGRRSGAGRKKGTLSRKTTELAEQAIARGVSPLEVMLKAMTVHYDAGEYDAAAAVAHLAAPYVHPRLSAMQVSGGTEVNVNVTVVGGIDLAAVVGLSPGLHHDRVGHNGEAD